MTALDLDTMEAIARAATPKRWSLFDKNKTLAILAHASRKEIVAWMGFDRYHFQHSNARRHATHIATFDPATVLALIAEHRALAARVKEMKAALEPFADFGIGVDGEDLLPGLMHDRILYWFGPSDFNAAREAARVCKEASDG